MTALLQTSLPGLHLLSKGKVRDIYATSSPDHLLFIATDRISVYDIILKNVCGYLNPFLSDFNVFLFLGYPRQGQTPHKHLTILVPEAEGHYS
jgi:phosphoribosylaminoimidazole-succinocarboxamide synthase